MSMAVLAWELTVWGGGESAEGTAGNTVADVSGACRGHRSDGLLHDLPKRGGRLGKCSQLGKSTV